MITEEIGKRIKEIRSEKGISQEKLALKAELDIRYKFEYVHQFSYFQKNNSFSTLPFYHFCDS